MSIREGGIPPQQMTIAEVGPDARQPFSQRYRFGVRALSLIAGPVLTISSGIAAMNNGGEEGYVFEAVAVANDGNVCPDYDSGKIEPTGEQSVIDDIRAPEGFLISRVCVKAGSYNQGDGPEISNVEPPQKELDGLTHSSKKYVSHYSLNYVPVTYTTTTVVDSVPVTENPTTTVAPETTITVAPETTTTTTVAPETTITVAPETTTTTTVAPETTITVAPETTTTTTVAPETTITVAPETTTTTTVAPETTITVVNETTTTVASTGSTLPDTL